MKVVAKDEEAGAVVAAGEVAMQTSCILFLHMCLRISIKYTCALSDRNHENIFTQKIVPKPEFFQMSAGSS